MDAWKVERNPLRDEIAAVLRHRMLYQGVAPSVNELADAILARRDLITPTNDVLSLAHEWEWDENLDGHGNVNDARAAELRALTRQETSND